MGGKVIIWKKDFCIDRGPSLSVTKNIENLKMAPLSSFKDSENQSLNNWILY